MPAWRGTACLAWSGGTTASLKAEGRQFDPAPDHQWGLHVSV